MHDAYYTALVFKRLPKPERIFQYQETPRKLMHTERHARVRVTDMVPSVASALAGDQLQNPKCPKCCKPMKLQTELIPQSPGRYIALSKCAQHGVMFIKVRFMLLPDGQKGMNLTVVDSTQQTRAYVHTKELQYQFKRKRGDFDQVDVENISGSNAASMPFEEA